jgi:UDP:flavonoid glycosyltransferase YjiC (YdhE family)
MKVLAYTSPARGHLYPIVPILLELQRRGHEIALRTLASHGARTLGRRAYSCTLIGNIGRAVLDRAVMPSLDALRARHGLPALARFSDLLERPPLLLALTAEGFEYPRGDWPANVRLVGAINWAPPDPAAWPVPSAAPAQSTLPAQSAQTPAWLAELDDPLVLVTCSTEHQRDKRLIHVALEALPAAGMSVIATTAAHDPDEFGAPPRSRVVRFVPHDAQRRPRASASQIAGR